MHHDHRGRGRRPRRSRPTGSGDASRIPTCCRSPGADPYVTRSSPRAGLPATTGRPEAAHGFPSCSRRKPYPTGARQVRLDSKSRYSARMWHTSMSSSEFSAAGSRSLRRIAYFLLRCCTSTMSRGPTPAVAVVLDRQQIAREFDYDPLSAHMSHRAATRQLHRGATDPVVTTLDLTSQYCRPARDLAVLQRNRDVDGYVHRRLNRPWRARGT